MPSRKPVVGAVPPAFLMAEYMTTLSPDLAGPLHLLFQLRTCMQRVNADLTRWLGPDALSPGRMQMLMLLWASKKPLPQRDLVEHLQTSRASVSELVDALVRDGFVRTKADPSHGRRILVALTEAGRAAANSQIHGNAERLRTAFAGLRDDEQATLADLLGRLCCASKMEGP